jgi:hypothetical protein
VWFKRPGVSNCSLGYFLAATPISAEILVLVDYRLLCSSSAPNLVLNHSMSSYIRVRNLKFDCCTEQCKVVCPQHNHTFYSNNHLCRNMFALLGFLPPFVQKAWRFHGSVSCVTNMSFFWWWVIICQHVNFSSVLLK